MIELILMDMLQLVKKMDLTIFKAIALLISSDLEGYGHNDLG
jgi:hypothetical protein